MPRPKLTFFCELEPAPLQALFADPAVIDDLRALDAAVSLGIIDLGAERAEVVRQLAAAGIPVIAWQLLPKDQGYWFNTSNALEARARYGDFLEWTARHDLRWAGIGVDIESDIREAGTPGEDGGGGLLVPQRLWRLLNTQHLHTAQAEYDSLIARMRADGYPVDSYILSHMVDEQKAGSTLTQRLMGLITIDADREIPMLYSSFTRPRGPALVWSYAQDVSAVALGSTGGGVVIDGVVTGDIGRLDFDDLVTDLLLASQWVDDIHLFSLEGCVAQGMLPRLRDLDWDQPIQPPYGFVQQIERQRQLKQATLWLSAHPAVVIAGLVAVLSLLPRRRKRGSDG
jgi:hypothetical protein